jgi:flavin reductase (DIM6/NTAB) family NADH-FMN oxidoreductase RutF
MPTYDRAQRFVVNILAQDQIFISNRFATSGPDRFDGIPFTLGIAGVPLIEGCASYLECKLEAAYPGGDHLLFVGRVQRIQLSERKPLAFGGGRYLVVHPHEGKP